MTYSRTARLPSSSDDVGRERDVATEPQTEVRLQLGESVAALDDLPTFAVERTPVCLAPIAVAGEAPALQVKVRAMSCAQRLALQSGDCHVSILRVDVVEPVDDGDVRPPDYVKQGEPCSTCDVEQSGGSAAKDVSEPLSECAVPIVLDDPSATVAPIARVAELRVAYALADPALCFTVRHRWLHQGRRYAAMP